MKKLCMFIILSSFIFINGCSNPKIGSCYELKQRNPFAKKTQIKILDFKRDFIQFYFINEPNKIESDRTPPMWQWKHYWIEIPCKYTEIDK